MDSLESIINKHAEAMQQETPQIEYPVETEEEPKSPEEEALEKLVAKDNIDYGNAEEEDAQRYQQGVDDYNEKRQQKIDENKANEELIKKIEVAYEEHNSPEHMEKGYQHQSKMIDLRVKFVQEELRSRGKHMELPNDVIISPDTGIETSRLAYVDGQLDMLIFDAKNDDEIREGVKKLVDEYWVVIEDEPTTTEEPKEEPKEEESKEETKDININIEAPDNTNVSVNIDKNLVGSMTREKVINVKVVEVSEKSMKTVKTFKPFDRSKIKPVSLGANGVTITLPASCYRCTMEPMQYFEYIRAVTSVKTEEDQVTAFYSLIYKHMTNVSIGDFSTYEDFLRNTKSTDLGLLLWALAAATMSTDEQMTIYCRDPKCMIPAEKDSEGNVISEAVPRTHIVTYDPRKLIHVDYSKLPTYYPEVENAMAGAEAKRVFEKYSDYNERNYFPDSNISFIISVPSFYDDLYNLDEVETNVRNRHNLAINQEFTLEAEMDFAIHQYLKSFIIDTEEGPMEASTFEDITYVYENVLTSEQQMILYRAISECRNKANNTPMDFYIENDRCPYCNHITKRIRIQPIGQEMLFHLTRKFESQKIVFDQQLTK
mgnify:CR=1 FL=1